jgi:GT2 family glycosyltransferase
MSHSLSVSVVTYAPDFAVVGETLRTLAVAIGHARASGLLAEAQVALVDNGPGADHAPLLGALLERDLPPTVPGRLLSGNGNVGYGRGHNLALRASGADYHLVLNPDVALAADAMQEAVRYLNAHPSVAMLAPLALDPGGERLYLCKRYPSVLDLLLRGFAPAPVRRAFRARLERYEMRDLPDDRPATGIPILSGSFMLCRRAPVAAIGGFSDDFFLYFEDFDLSLRAAAQGELVWVPAVRIVHRGGHAARKGWRHRGLFIASAVKFFNRHGWKWA